MKYHVIMEEPAITEIERNARWWAEHYSSHQALVWYDAAVDAIYSLESQPERHALSPENQKSLVTGFDLVAAVLHQLECK